MSGTSLITMGGKGTVITFHLKKSKGMKNKRASKNAKIREAELKRRIKLEKRKENKTEREGKTERKSEYRDDRKSFVDWSALDRISTGR